MKRTFLLCLTVIILFLSGCNYNLPENTGRVKIEDSYEYGRILKVWTKSESDSSWQMAWHDESDSDYKYVYFNIEPGKYKMKLSYNFYNAVPLTVYSGLDYSITVTDGNYTNLIFDGFYLFEE